MTGQLIDLLRHRVAIIANHPWRDRDPAGHLDALKSVSEEIVAWTDTHHATLDPQLRHYLAKASFQKALIHLEELKHD